MRRPLTLSTIANVAAPALVFGIAYDHVLRGEEPLQDISIVRSLRPSFGVFHRVDVIVASIANFFPTVARVHVASLATLITVSLFAYIVVATMQRALSTLAPSSQWAAPIALVGTLAALLSAPWQCEASIPGGEAIAALLGTIPILLYAQAAASASRDFWIGGCVGLAMSEDPRVACASVLSLLAVRFSSPAESAKGAMASQPVLLGGALGLLPLAAHLAFGDANLRRLADGFLSPPPLPIRAALPLVWASCGGILVALGAIGALLGLRNRTTRPLTVALVTQGALGSIIGLRSWGARPVVWGGGTLLFVLCATLLATFALFAIVQAVESSRARFARMTTAMVFLLELAIVVERVEVARDFSAGRDGVETAAWRKELFASLPERSVIVVSTRTTWLPLEAARLSGELGERLLIPTFSQSFGVTEDDLRDEPPLRALVRELSLGSPPSEWALSSLADSRAVFLEFNPAWDRAISRHLTLERLLPEYHAAPRGAAELHKSWEEWQERGASAVRRAESWEGGRITRWHTTEGHLPPVTTREIVRTSGMAQIVLHLLHVRGTVLAVEADLPDLGRLAAAIEEQFAPDPWAEEVSARIQRAKPGKGIDLRGLVLAE